MWLLDTSTLELKEFTGTNVAPYAILSHTWGVPEEEVSFRDIRKQRDVAQQKAGYTKVINCCLKAVQDGYSYAWIDSCCIDKRSSAELSEAINAMFKWYQNAEVCYVYLDDVPSSAFDPSPDVVDDVFSKSRWFTRGWTLQELIAPRRIKFFGQDWNLIGTKELQAGFHPPASIIDASVDSFLSKLAKITAIKKKVLQYPELLTSYPVAQRMSWAAQRQTTREEDLAYALMGLFGVSMPILYGEGQQKAFKRLQLEIIRSSADQSIFAWRSRSPRISSGLLAKSPLDFAMSGDILWTPTAQSTRPFSMTNMGLSINIPLQCRSSTPETSFFVASLSCFIDVDGVLGTVRIHLERVSPEGSVLAMYRRRHCNMFDLAKRSDDPGPREDIYVIEEEQRFHIMYLQALGS